MAANSDSRPTLLLGASGFFGPSLIEAFGRSGTVVTHFSHGGPGSLHFDARNSSLCELVSGLAVKPRAAVILFGVTNIDACARDPSGTAEVNVKGVVRIIDQLRALDIMPVFASSDAVFDGSRALWSEDSATRPILEYGKQKLAVEHYLSSLAPPWLIVRLPKLLSSECNPRCMLGGWINALGDKKDILCATDQYFTPADAADAARAIAILVRQAAQGVYHLGGPQRLSRRELLDALLEEYRRFAVPQARIVDCSIRDVPVLEPRPLDTSLNSSRFTARFGDHFSAAGRVAQLAAQAFFAAKTG